MNIPTITSIGPPPERHAERVVAEMTHWLIDEEKRLNRLMCAVIRETRSSLGSPIAQKRLVERLRRAGGRGIVDMKLEPGKRARFSLRWVSWRVVAPGGDNLDPDQPIPEKPWLACTVHYLKGGGGDLESYRAFTMSHHAMVRLAMRCNARVPNDLLDALSEIFLGLFALIDRYDTVEDAIKAMKICRLPVAGGVAVLELVDNLGVLVKTVLDPDME